MSDQLSPVILDTRVPYRVSSPGLPAAVAVCSVVGTGTYFAKRSAKFLKRTMSCQTSGRGQRRVQSVVMVTTKYLKPSTVKSIYGLGGIHDAQQI